MEVQILVSPIKTAGHPYNSAVPVIHIYRPGDARSQIGQDKQQIPVVANVAISAAVLTTQ